MMPEITTEQVDRIGELADTCDNLLAALSLPVSPHIHIAGCRGGLEDIKERATALYKELGGTEL